MRLLMLHTNPLTERVGVAPRIESEHRYGAAIRNAIALDAFHRRRLASAVRTDESEDLALQNFEGHVVDSGRLAVTLTEVADRDYRKHG
jgi:hypothetical protein